MRRSSERFAIAPVMAIHHRISIEYGFPSGELGEYPYRLRAFHSFLQSAIHYCCRIFLFSLYARRIFFYVKSQLNFIVATGKTRRYEIIEQTIPSSRVSFNPQNCECTNAKKHLQMQFSNVD